MAKMDYGKSSGPVQKTDKTVNQKTKGASVKSGLSDQQKITKKTARGETTGQRPKCPKESGPGPYTFKA